MEWLPLFPCSFLQPRGVARRSQLPGRHGRRGRGTAAGDGQEMEHAAGERRAAAGALQGPAIRRLARGTRHLRPDIQVPPQLRQVVLVGGRRRRQGRPSEFEAAPRAGMV